MSGAVAARLAELGLTLPQVTKPVASYVPAAVTGNLVFTGTPEGVAMGMTPPKWLKAGDRVRVEIDGLGALDNPVRAEP